MNAEGTKVESGGEMTVRTGQREAHGPFGWMWNSFSLQQTTQPQILHSKTEMICLLILTAMESR